MDIPDHIIRRAKAAAALQGKSLKSFLTEAVIHELERRVDKKISRRRVSLPLIPSNRPGKLQLNADVIAKVLDNEDYRALAGH